MGIYIASDVALPLIPFDRTRPAFNVSEIAEHASAVRQHFTKPYVYYAGAHTQCGCGFEYGSEQGGIDPKEAEARQDSRQQLAQYLRNALAFQESLELLMCWLDQEQVKPKRAGTITPEDLIGTHVNFLGTEGFEFQLLTIVAKH